MDLRITYFVITGGLAVLGFLGNLYIFLCLVLLRGKDDREKVSHTINLTIATVSLLQAFGCISQGLYAWMTKTIYQDIIFHKTVLCIGLSFIFSSICIMAVLFILYWYRIVPIQCRVILKVKKRFFELLSWVIACSIFICFSTSTYLFKFDFCCSNSTYHHPSQYFCQQLNAGDYIFTAILVLLFLILPSGLMVFTSCSILVHLNQHIQQMQSKDCKISCPQLGREHRAMHMLFCQLLLYSIFVGFCFILLILEAMEVKHMLQNWSPGISCGYFLSTAINLIYRNVYLRKMTTSLFDKLKSHRLH